jgi:hypothetical protein
MSITKLFRGVAIPERPTLNMYEDNSFNIGPCKILKIIAKAVVPVKKNFQNDGIDISPCEIHFEKTVFWKSESLKYGTG